MRRARGVVALISGGLDSYCLVRGLLASGSTVWPLYVRCGFFWERAELSSARRWLAELRRAQLKPLHLAELPARSLYGEHWALTGRGAPSDRTGDAAVYLPGRNVVLLSQAAIYAARGHAGRVALGTLAGNPFGDATPQFFRQFGGCLTQALDVPIRIDAPLRRRTKAQIIRVHADGALALTWSCIRPTAGRQCGRCNKCAERRRAFRAAKIPDPTPYARIR